MRSADNLCAGCTSLASPRRTMRTIFRLVVPRMIESSMRMTRLPASKLCTGLSLRRTPKSRTRCSGFNEGSADIMVANETHAERKASLLSVSEGRGDSRVGNRNDNIGGYGGLARQLAAHLVAALLNPAAVDAAVRASEVNVFKNATGLRNPGSVLAAGDAVFRDHDQFAGEDVADILGAEQVERARLGSEDNGVRTVGVANAAHGKRPEAAWIACREDAVAGHHHNRECTFDLG